MPLHLDHQVRGYGDRAYASCGLWGSVETGAVGKLLSLLDHVDPPVQEIHPVTSKGQKLTKAESAKRGQQDDQPIASFNDLSQLVDRLRTNPWGQSGIACPLQESDDLRPSGAWSLVLIKWSR